MRTVWGRLCLCIPMHNERPVKQSRIILMRLQFLETLWPAAMTRPGPPLLTIRCKVTEPAPEQKKLCAYGSATIPDYRHWRTRRAASVCNPRQYDRHRRSCDTSLKTGKQWDLWLLPTEGKLPEESRPDTEASYMGYPDLEVFFNSSRWFIIKSRGNGIFLTIKFGKTCPGTETISLAFHLNIKSYQYRAIYYCYLNQWCGSVFSYSDPQIFFVFGIGSLD
jgi:hypothetical protein